MVPGASSFSASPDLPLALPDSPRTPINGVRRGGRGKACPLDSPKSLDPSQRGRPSMRALLESLQSLIEAGSKNRRR